MSLLVRLTRLELSGILRRRWFLATVAAGIAWVIAAVVVGAGHDGLVRADSYRAGIASLLLVGGLVAAIGLGATTIARGGDTGHLGLLVGSGAPRSTVALARVVARVLALALTLAVWLVAAQAGSAALGRGWDGPLAVHVAASGETLAVVLLAAAATSTVLGPAIAAIVGLLAQIAMQAVVNLKAATDAGLLGAWNRAAQVAYNLLPRAVMSPMIVDMQNRGQGGPAAPRFEVALDSTRDLGIGADTIPVALPPATVGTVLFTLFWCVVLGYLTVLGMRRRTL